MTTPLHLTYISGLAVITIIMALIYVTVQQNYRMSANDPQIQLARDMADRLEHNRSIANLFAGDTVDLSKSMAPFTIFYDADKKPVRSTAMLNGGVPQLPGGVLDYTKNNNEDWITWQPQKNIRMATIVKHVFSPTVAYVAVGRSLKEIEVREANLTKMVAICWVICITIIAATWGWQFTQLRKTLHT